MSTEKVKERVYRCFARPMEEINAAITLMQEQKEGFYKIINEFELLSASDRRNIIKYLEEFYDTVKNPKDVQRIFIDNARTN